MRKDRADTPPFADAEAPLTGTGGGGSRGAHRLAARRLARRLADEQLPVLERAQQLSQRPETQARLVACELVPLSFDEDPEEAMAVLHDLAGDADPKVRAAAVSACARIVRTHFGRVVETLSRWRDGPCPHVRRAVLVSVTRAAEATRLERVPHLIRLIEPLLADRDPVVQRLAGPSALGALLGAYPDVTFDSLIEWSTSSDAHVLRNVAMAFTSAPAAPVAKRALIILRKLALDERRAVWRAVAAAMWQLGRRRPDVVRPELERWLADETRAKVAREALKYL
jgi:hypothetical protein